MKVKDLIVELQKFDPELEVVDIDCLIIEEARADRVADKDNGKIDVVRLL